MGPLDVLMACTQWEPPRALRQVKV